MAAVHPSRPHLRRNSPLSVFQPSHGFSAGAPAMKGIDVGDSDSDDEPPPMMFSKVTQALLNDAPMPSSPPKQEQPAEAPRFNRSVSANNAGLDTPSRRSGVKIVRKSSPSALVAEDAERGSTPPRIVQVGSSKPGSGRRTISIGGPYPSRLNSKREPTPTAEGNQGIVTPAPAPRSFRVNMTRARADSNASQDEKSHLQVSSSRPGSSDGPRRTIESEESRPQPLSRSTSTHHLSEIASKYPPPTVGRTKNISADPTHAPGSQRIKRAPIGTGSFLKSGPVRRGFRRRDSEDNVSPNEEYHSVYSSHPSATPQDVSEGSAMRADSGLGRSRSGSVNQRAPSVEPVSAHDFAHPKSHFSAESRPSSRQASSYHSRSQMSAGSRPPSREASREPLRPRQPSVEPPHNRSQSAAQQSDAPAPLRASQRQASVEPVQPKPAADQQHANRPPSLQRAQYRYVPPKMHNDPHDDQENMPPPTFKRNKDQEFKYLGKPSISVLSDDEKPKQRQVEETPVPVQQQERKALGALSGNTPHRPAPAPPPKMNVLETATTTAGASTTKSRKKRSHMVINGKIFNAMGKIGKGGSSDVYRVMAENFKIFALKKVKLDGCDESAVTGYKGEIDLLKKLTDVERVVRLYDYELSEEQKVLWVLMEPGETDLNRVLTLKLTAPEARLDTVFIRYHWKEMLECVRAVHDHDIVHSDLKPANFLLVSGKLKLIDFGIANAIDTDNTVNVHRDSHVGTPNYMSPESITDTNAPRPGESSRSHVKDMRIGKASDVWSLGCILYQMTYGRPPFAHIANQYSRIVAITDPKHAIDFPLTGVGSAPVPASLRRTLRKCLNRDPALRPSVHELLEPMDQFLYPEGDGRGVWMSEEMLGQIIGRVVERCRDPKRGVPTSEEVRQYPASFVAKIQEMVEKG
ncbi:hypothetical protein MBLNU230_g5740t1 [Neophaeotheca triangularis]